MRLTRLLAPALGLLLSTAAVQASPARFVACFAREPGALRAAPAREALAARLAAARVSPLRSLGEGLPALAPEAAARAGARPGGRAFDFDPARIWLLAAEDSGRAAAALAADPAVEWFELEQAREAWALTTGSNDLLLAVADTGIDPAHPELQALLPDGRTRIAFPFNATDEFGATVIDSNGHGTPVAGVVAARTNEGAHFDSLGVAGLCGGDGAANFGCRIVPIKIVRGHEGAASSFDIARAILHATAVGARAMNLSFAGNGPSRAERTAMHWALVHGCVVVAASGNRGASTPTLAQYPAAYSADGFGIQAGASDMFDRRAVFSSYGPGLDLVAPGVSVWTTYLTYASAFGVKRNGYVPAAGTSFSAPHVTGAVGLLAAWRPELTDTDFQVLLRESADDIGAPGVDAETGWGRLDVARALRAIPPTFGVWHDEVAASVVSDTSAGALLPTDSLVVGEDGPGAMTPHRVWRDARLVEVRATVAIPDSFVDSVRVWPRLGGTLSVRSGFRLPYFAPFCEVVARDARSFTLRGWLYRLAPGCEACGEEGWLPLPPDQARFGFTVIGKVDRAAAVPAAEAPPPPLRVAPNPSRGAVRIEALGTGPGAPGRLTVLDLSGRVVARARAASPGAWTWDGRDERGRSAPAGLYFARCEDGDGRVRVARMVRLDAARPAP